MASIFGKRLNNDGILAKMRQLNIDSLAIYDGDYGFFGQAKRDSIFEVASLTKVVFAFIVLRLAVLGIIDLDTPIVSYNASLKTSLDLRFKDITPRNILSHSSGLANWSHTKNLRIHFNPGSSFMYSGEGYELLQKVVEKVLNKDIEAIFTEYVFEPFHMDNSYLRYNDCFKEKLIACFDSHGKKEINREPMTNPNVAYSLYTTIEDYQTFCQHFFIDKEFPRELALMLNKQVCIIDNLDWNLGIACLDDNFYWQHGDNDNFKNFVVYDKERNQNCLFFSNSFNGLKLIYDYLVALCPDFSNIKKIIF